MKKLSAKDFPHTWGWKVAQIEAALRDPTTPAHVREELRALEHAAIEQLENEPGLKLYRANAAMLQAMATQMPLVRDATLDEALGAADAVRSHAAKKAAKKNAGRGRASRYTREFNSWRKRAAQIVARQLPADYNEFRRLKAVYARQIREETGTSATERYLARWLTTNWDAIERAAIELRMVAASKRAGHVH